MSPKDIARSQPRALERFFFLFMVSLFFCFPCFFFLLSKAVLPYKHHTCTAYHTSKRPQVKTVPYCTYMIAFMHKPLSQFKILHLHDNLHAHTTIHKKDPKIKIVPYCMYMITPSLIRYISFLL